jgi:DNA-binding MarR family transcriptional regulator
MTTIQKPSNPNVGPVAFEFFNEIGIIEQLARARFERVLPEGMSMAQFSVLNNFVRLGGNRTPSGLASAFQVTRGAMTNTLQRLETHGFIAIRTDPKDGRGKIVEITDAGRSARDECIVRLAPILSDFVSAFPVSFLGPIIEPLAAIRRHLDSNR